MNIMELKDIGYAYESKKKVLKSINLSVEEGRMYAILSPSGCGKTTLLSLILKESSPIREPFFKFIIVMVITFS